MDEEHPTARSGPGVQLNEWGARFGQKHLLTGITFSLTKPGVVVLMGPVGTGKSVLLKAIAGQLSAYGLYEGAILIDGENVKTAPLLPALVQQHPRELAFTVGEILTSALRAKGAFTPVELKEQAAAHLRKLGQDALLPLMSAHLFTLPNALLRRTLIVRAALSDSRFLLIDEPTAGLDANEADDVLQLIRTLAHDHTCLVVLHHQAQARAIASRIILLAGGRLQVDMDVAGFFRNDTGHEVLDQFLRTGSCCPPSLQAHEQVQEAAEPAYSAPAAVESEPVPGEPVTAPSGPPDCAPASVDTPPTYFIPQSRGPHGFRWLVPGKLGGCPMPGVMLPLEYDLGLLRGVGVTVLINLTEEPMTQAAIPAAGLRTIHMGVEDRNVPPMLWMKLLLARIERLIEQGEVVAVHCLAGLGRTGTVLGAWLVKNGLTAEESLRRLRLIEPGFVQSQVQEDFLAELELNLLIRAPEV